MLSDPALRRSLLAATLAGAAVLAVPVAAAASIPRCTDPFEAPHDTAELQPGVTTERGFCAPDGSDGGGDHDWLAFPADAGHRYRIELVERGTGFDHAHLVIDEAYDGRTATPQFTPESPHAKTTSPLPDGTLIFSVTAAAADRTLPTGDDLGYQVLVTDLGSEDAADPAPAVASVTLAASTVRAGASTTAAVVLDRPASAGGVEATLSSNDARVTVPVTVSVPAGQDRVSVPVDTSRSRARYTATITASTASGSAATTLQVR